MGPHPHTPVDFPAPAEITDSVTFTAPPVNEVALTVQFEGDVVDEVGMLANYWPRIRSDFPGHDKQPPLPPLQEDFTRPPDAGVQFQFMPTLPAPRYWFISRRPSLAGSS